METFCHFSFLPGSSYSSSAANEREEEEEEGGGSKEKFPPKLNSSSSSSPTLPRPGGGGGGEGGNSGWRRGKNVNKKKHGATRWRDAGDARRFRFSSRERMLCRKAQQEPVGTSWAFKFGLGFVYATWRNHVISNAWGMTVWSLLMTKSSQPIPPPNSLPETPLLILSWVLLTHF